MCYINHLCFRVLQPKLFSIRANGDNHSSIRTSFRQHRHSCFQDVGQEGFLFKRDFTLLCRRDFIKIWFVQVKFKISYKKRNCHEELSNRIQCWVYFTHLPPPTFHCVSELFQQTACFRSFITIFLKLATCKLIERRLRHNSVQHLFVKKFYSFIKYRGVATIQKLSTQENEYCGQ